MTIKEMNQHIESIKKIANFTDEAKIEVQGFYARQYHLTLSQTINGYYLTATIPDDEPPTVKE